MKVCVWMKFPNIFNRLNFPPSQEVTINRNLIWKTKQNSTQVHSTRRKIHKINIPNQRKIELGELLRSVNCANVCMCKIDFKLKEKSFDTTETRDNYNNKSNNNDDDDDQDGRNTNNKNNNEIMKKKNTIYIRVEGKNQLRTHLLGH